MLFSIPWTIGGCLDVDSRKKFDAFYRELMTGKFDEHPIPKELGKLELPFPAENTTYDFFFEVSTWNNSYYINVNCLVFG